MLAKGRAARRTCGPLIFGSIMKRWRWKTSRSHQAPTLPGGTPPFKVAKSSHQLVTASQKPKWGAKAPLIQVILSSAIRKRTPQGVLHSLFCGGNLPTNLQLFTNSSNNLIDIWLINLVYFLSHHPVACFLWLPCYLKLLRGRRWYHWETNVKLQWIDCFLLNLEQNVCQGNKSWSYCALLSSLCLWVIGSWL